MPLPDDYLRYPHRSHGMDHTLYPWSNLFERPPVAWPGGAPVALWVTVALEYFPLTPDDGPVRAPGHMVTPYPDYRTYTTRDYGNRVGIYRILKLLNRFGLKAGVPMNAAIATRYPYLVEAVLKGGHEVIAHGLDMNRLHYGGLPREDEDARIAETLDILRRATGQPVTGWLSPARSESENTPHLLPGHGIGYLCDWVNDDMPYGMTTEGGPLIAMPHTYELEDRHQLVTLGHTEDRYVEEVLDAFTLFRVEASRHGGRILHIALTPYVIGQPFRIHALETLFTRLAYSGAIWSATGAEIAAAWQAGQPAPQEDPQGERQG